MLQDLILGSYVGASYLAESRSGSTRSAPHLSLLASGDDALQAAQHWRVPGVTALCCGLLSFLPLT